MRTLILALVILSCSREQPGIEFNCLTPGLPQPVKAISVRLDSFEFTQEKANPDFTLSVFYAFRQGVNTKGTFSIYLTAGNMGGIAYVLGRRKNIAPKADVAVIFCTNLVPEYDTFTGVHEIGHLCGSQHTHECVWNWNNTSIDECVRICNGLNEPGSVMSYCFDACGNIYFHPQCLDTIKANIRDIK